MSKTARIYLRLISLLFFIFIGYVLYSANTGREILFFQILEYIPMGDKFAHVILIGTLAYLFNMVLGAKTFKVNGVQILVGSLIVFGLMTVEEFSQMYIPTRNFDWVDLAANYLGIGIADKMIKSKYKIPIIIKKSAKS